MGCAENFQNEELIKIIAGLIRERGRIPFSEFMETVLYDPAEGYYNAPGEKIGPRGDFYTSSDIHPVFGHLLARQLHEMWQILGEPSPFTILEMGPGRGLLCADILGYCRGQLPSFYEAIRYLLVEISPSLRENQKAFLSGFPDHKITWVAPGLLGNEFPPVTGCVLSNELVDSFPVHLVRQQDSRLQEIYVALQNDGFAEISCAPSTPALREYLDVFGSPFEEGQRGEINLKALDWLEGVDRILRRGFVLTLDYGYEAGLLYHPERRDGTLLCYFRHSTSTNPYERIGCQDITAHVNFTALLKKGESLGFVKIGYTEQYKFLAALGLLHDLEDLEENQHKFSVPEFLKHKLAMKTLLFPGGMGTLFKVLAQGKEVGKPELQGFQDPFKIRYD